MRTTELAAPAHRGISANASTTLVQDTAPIAARLLARRLDSRSRATTDARKNGRVLPRRLGVWSTAAAMVGLMIGSGIFVVPALVAANVGSVPGIVAAWTLGAGRAKSW